MTKKTYRRPDVETVAGDIPGVQHGLSVDLTTGDDACARVHIHGGASVIAYTSPTIRSYGPPRAGDRNGSRVAALVAALSREANVAGATLRLTLLVYGTGDILACCAMRDWELENGFKPGDHHLFDIDRRRVENTQHIDVTFGIGGTVKLPYGYGTGELTTGTVVHVGSRSITCRREDGQLAGADITTFVQLNWSPESPITPNPLQR